MRNLDNIENEMTEFALNYVSFTEAWREEMGDYTLDIEVRTYIAYRMFSEGQSTDTVADLVKGIGPETARWLKEQWDNGVPVTQVRTSRPRR
jgi:hypothetical protein